MTFHIITLFPEAIESYLKSSVVGRARKKGLVKIKYHSLLGFAPRKDRRIDDRPYGGGPGMVMQIEPILKAIQAVKIRNKQKAKVILFSPAGKQFTNESAKSLTTINHLILICGRYEGIDERIKKVLANLKLKTEELSIGPYVLTGGELPGMVVVDAVSRQIKGVLGREESLEEKRLGIGIPAYTRPEIFTYRGKSYRVPKALTTGNHTQIESWRKKHRKN